MFLLPHAQAKQPLLQSAAFLIVIDIPQCAHLKVNGNGTSGVPGCGPLADPGGAQFGGLHVCGVPSARTGAEAIQNTNDAASPARTRQFGDFIGCPSFFV